MKTELDCQNYLRAGVSFLLCKLHFLGELACEGGHLLVAFPAHFLLSHNGLGLH